jgi:hypothetical protein
MATSTHVLAYIEQSALKAGVATSSLPLLEKISYCESGLNPEAVNINKNQTEDFGPLQVNDSHKNEMEALGMNYNSWQDTVDFAILLFQKQGTKPWNSSKSCWSTDD